jgi:hypothetical protein
VHKERKGRRGPVKNTVTGIQRGSRWLGAGGSFFVKDLSELMPEKQIIIKRAGRG